MPKKNIARPPQFDQQLKHECSVTRSRAKRRSLHCDARRSSSIVTETHYGAARNSIAIKRIDRINQFSID